MTRDRGERTLRLRRNDADATWPTWFAHVVDPEGYTAWQKVVLRCVAMVCVTLCVLVAIGSAPALIVIAVGAVVLVKFADSIG